jgi:hypothetical protein
MLKTVLTHNAESVKLQIHICTELELKPSAFMIKIGLFSRNISHKIHQTFQIYFFTRCEASSSLKSLLN